MSGSGYQRAGGGSPSYQQGFGCASLSNISGALVISPFDWETNASNAAASTAITALFPLQGGIIQSLSVYYVLATLAVNVEWLVRVDGVDTLLGGTIPSGSQGPLLAVLNPVTIAPGAHTIQLKGQAAAAPGSGIIRVRAVMTGVLN
jgi:hypothetical protein